MDNDSNEKLVYIVNEVTEDDEPPSLLFKLDGGNSNTQIIRHRIHPKRDDNKMVISKNTRSFLQSHFPEATDKDWNDWHWQLKNSITTLAQLQQIANLSEKEIQSIIDHKNSLPLRITPYYASLISQENSLEAIRRSVVPTTDELIVSEGEASDPLAEHHDSPCPVIVHRYPDRVLFLSTDFCSTYCRYCTRSHMVGKEKGHFSNDVLQQGIDYIRNHPAVRDVLISGGDVLTLSDTRIEYILSNIHEIPHVEIIRIGTKVPVVLPQRITKSLVSILKKYHPLFMSIHFTHPDELTPETVEACARLADAGIPLGSQTVLLKGINDDAEVMRKLMQGLLKARVRPYYLYQCDPILGSAHFRTSVNKGLEIIKSLRGFTTGYAVPNYVIDAPAGGGKIPLLPEYYQGRDDNKVILKNYEDKLFSYPDHI